jgi:hypothetical protein
MTAHSTPAAPFLFSIRYFLFAIPLRLLKSQISNLKLLIFAFLSAFTCFADTVSAASSDPLPENRFLIIAETSSPMEKRAAGLGGTIDQLLRSGMRGQARPGDTIGIWTYNDTLNAGEFPLQTWSKDAGKHISSGVLAFLADQKCSKQPRFDCVLPTLLPIVKDSDFITVIIIFSGVSPIKGTPYDKEIAQAVAAWRGEQQKAHMPIVVALRAAHGTFDRYSVTPAPWQVDMPPLPPELVAASLARRSAQTNSPQASSVPPLIVVGKRKDPPAPALPAATNTPAVAPTNEITPVALAAPAPSISSSTNLSSNVANTETSPPSPQTSSELVVHARELNPLATTPANPAHTHPAALILKISVLAGLAFAAVCLLAFIRRPRETRVSLITHSINRDR